MADDYMNELATAIGLRHYPSRGPFGQKEGAVMGTRDGYLIAAGPTKDAGGRSAISLLIRFPRTENVEGLRSAIKTTMAGQKGQLEDAGNDFVRWTWTYPLKRPKAADVAALLPPLLDGTRKVAPGLDGKCESCRSVSSSEIMLLNGVPSLYCPNCQNDLQMKMGMAAQAYTETPVNLPNGLLFGVAAALAGAIAWGGVAYLLNYIFLWGAIGIGFIVAWAVIKGAGRTNLAAKVLIGVLTVASVLFGDAIFFTLSAMKEMDLPFSGELLGLVLQNFWELESDASGILSLLFALVGAGYAAYQARRPSFAAQFERL